MLHVSVVSFYSNEHSYFRLYTNFITFEDFANLFIKFIQHLYLHRSFLKNAQTVLHRTNKFLNLQLH